MDRNHDPSAPLHANLLVKVARPGVCGFCGRGTAYACRECSIVHFCSARCLERGGAHDCGGPSCKAVDLPDNSILDRSSGGLANCWINAHLRGGAGFALPPPKRTRPLQPSLSYGLKPLQLDPKVAADLSDVCKSNWDPKGYLKIGAISYPGYAGYTAIPGVVNNWEQSRATAQLTRRGALGTGGLNYYRERGLQYAINNCEALRLLVEEVCSHLGGR